MKADVLNGRDIPLFAGIEPAERDELLHCLKATTRRYAAGEYILLDREQIRRVGVVLSGTVHLLREDHAGRHTLLSYLTAGEIFGETDVLRQEALSDVSYYAASDSEILFLSMEHLITPCKSACPFHARLLANTLRVLGEEYRQLMEKIEICTKGTLREKILSYLEILGRRQGQKYISVPLSRTEMASYLQANRSAMTRELASMKAEELIDFDGSTFVLL